MKKLILGLVISLSLSGCFTESSDDGDAVKPQESFYFVGSDYTTGALYELNYESKKINSVLKISQDSKIISTTKGLIVLERGNADNILLLNSETNTVIYQVAIEAGANAHDLVEYKSEGILSLYNTAKLLRIDLATGDSLGELDLSSYAVKGTITPNADDLEIHNDLLYVSLQRLDAGWVPSEAMILVINPKNFDIIDTITTKGKNPSQLLINNNSLIAVFDGTTIYDVDWNSSSGNDGYIASFNLNDHKETTIITEAELKAKPKKLLIDNDKWYLSYSAGHPLQPVGILNSKTKTIEEIDGVVNASGGLAIFNSTLIIGEREKDKQAIKIFDGKTLETLSGDFLAPYSIQVLK